MTNSTDPGLPSASTTPPGLSDDLPPVQPPSAGFIVQLFVVPGLIVIAVVCVYFLFGSIAASEQDWRSLVEELQSPNAHIRKRAMHGLSQVLLDQNRGRRNLGEQANNEIAATLSDQLARELKANASSQESVAMQAYLTRAVGLLDAPQSTLPSLRKALEPTRDLEVRKSGVFSIATIAGRAFEKGHPLDDPETVDALVDLSTDSQPVMRQTAAFALGFFKSTKATDQLHVLLANSDWKTCVNAAIALARNDNSDGLSVFKQALTSKPPEKQDEQIEHFLILTNTLKAIAALGPKMSDADRAEFREILRPLTTDHAEIRIRVDAQNALQALK